MQAMVKRFFAWLIKYRSLYIISLLTLLCVELLNHPSLNLIEYGAWILTHLQMMIMNYILYLNIAVVLFLIIRRMSIANMILSVVMIVIGICNYFKTLYERRERGPLGCVKSAGCNRCNERTVFRYHLADHLNRGHRPWDRDLADHRFS